MEAETECKVPGVYSETGIPVEDPAPGLNSDVSKKDAPPAVAAPGPGLYFEIGKKARGVHALFILFGSLFDRYASIFEPRSEAPWPNSKANLPRLQCSILLSLPSQESPSCQCD